MSTDQDMMDIIDYTAEFQSTRLCGDSVEAKWVIIWHKIACVAHKKHVTDIRLKHSCHDDTTVHAWKHDSLWLHSINIIIIIEYISKYYGVR